ncbi:Rv3235 family protein [Mycolicibacterium baixiangningiae]|uniref:Rv3235 family protein n=1 Tax=Mycolicibacterium baixiangningiae TaxID=2761578 RepID=UPI0018685958|nr:Rv3235 family protein [Mycolicibacterium baixiangningiae]
MTTSPSTPAERPSFTSPVVDYEPAPTGLPATACPPPSPAALHRRTPRMLRPAPCPDAEPAAPRAAAVFADVALRRLLEVLDRRRPLVHLKPLLAPPLLDAVGTLCRVRYGNPAKLRRVRLRSAGPSAAEVSATYTRGDRVRAIAARVELTGDGRWQVVALQIG